MRKVFTKRSLTILLCSVGLISFTFLFANNSYQEICSESTTCTKSLETNELYDGDALLWESLSRQFVVSIVPN